MASTHAETDRAETMARARELARAALATREAALLRGPFWPDYADALAEADRGLADVGRIYARLDLEAAAPGWD